VTPCPTPGPTLSKTRPVNREDNKANKASAVERPVRIEFFGLNAIPYCDALSELRSASEPVDISKMPDTDATERATTILKERLASRGYLRARVEAVRDEEARQVLFVVNEGERLSLSDIRFEGNRVFTTEELSQNYKGCVTQYAHDGFNGEVNDYCERLLANFMRSRGYLQARVQSANKISGRGIGVIVKVDEGPLYRLGQIKIEGNETLTPEQVRSRLDLREGDVANGEKIGKWLFDDLKSVYGEMGFIEYTAEPIPTFNRESGKVDFELVIEEGQRFKLSSIEFSGNTANSLNPGEVFLLKEGDYFNEVLFRESIKRLNDSGWFELVDEDKDVDYKKNPEEHAVSLVVKLKSKN